MDNNVKNKCSTVQQPEEMYCSYYRYFKLMPVTHKEDTENNHVIHSALQTYKLGVEKIKRTITECQLCIKNTMITQTTMIIRRKNVFPQQSKKMLRCTSYTWETIHIKP
jgi:hypothetical protein